MSKQVLKELRDLVGNIQEIEYRVRRLAEAIESDSIEQMLNRYKDVLDEYEETATPYADVVTERVKNIMDKFWICEGDEQD